MITVMPEITSFRYSLAPFGRKSGQWPGAVQNLIAKNADIHLTYFSEA